MNCKSNLQSSSMTANSANMFSNKICRMQIKFAAIFADCKSDLHLIFLVFYGAYFYGHLPRVLKFWGFYGMGTFSWIFYGVQTDRGFFT